MTLADRLAAALAAPRTQRLAARLLDGALAAAAPPRAALDRLAAVAGYARGRYVTAPPRVGDIFVASYPKAGTTWVQMIVHQLATAGRGEFRHINHVVPWYEKALWTDNAAYVAALAPPRFFKTHLPYDLLRPPAHVGCLYVTRNVFDTVASHHHHQRLILDYPHDLAAFVREATAPGGPLTPNWFDHLASWWPHRDDANVLHVRYEDLQRDLAGEVRRIAYFCELDLAEDRLGDVLARCSFAYMKQHDARFDPRLGQLNAPPAAGFFRQGGAPAPRAAQHAALAPAPRAALAARLAALRARLGAAPDAL